MIVSGISQRLQCYLASFLVLQQERRPYQSPSFKHNF